jgi:hypothetical protein
MSAVLLPRVRFGAENLRQLEVVSRDEAFVAGALWNAWEQRLPEYSQYGDLYWNIGLVSLLVTSPFRDIGQQQAIIVLRLVSLACFLLVGVIAYLWGRRLTGTIGGFAFSSLLFTMVSADVDSMNRVVCVQPDMLNLLASLAAFFACLELATKLSRVRLLLAAGLAGMVMAVKHSGFLFLPLILLVLLFHALYADEEGLSRHAARVERPLLWFHYAIGAALVTAMLLTPGLLRKGHTLQVLPLPPTWPRLLGLGAYFGGLVGSYALLLGVRAVRPTGAGLVNRVGFVYSSMIAALAAFVLVFVALSPSSWEGLRFARGLVRYAGDIQRSFGYDRISAWARLLVRFLPGPIPLTLALAGGVVVVFSAIKSGLRATCKRTLASLIWVVLTTGFFVLRVSFVQNRFVFPLLPAMCLLAVQPVLRLSGFLVRKRLRPGRLVAVLAVLSYVPAGCHIGRQMLRTRADFSDLESLPGYRAGRWLDANLPSSTRIIFNSGIYVPPRFKDAHAFYSGDPYRQIEEYDPDVVMVNMLLVRGLWRRADRDLVAGFAIPVGTVRRFYADLLEQRLPFKQAAFIPDSARGHDIVILRRKREPSNLQRGPRLDSSASSPLPRSVKQQ